MDVWSLECDKKGPFRPLEEGEEILGLEVPKKVLKYL